MYSELGYQSVSFLFVLSIVHHRCTRLTNDIATLSYKQTTKARGRAVTTRSIYNKHEYSNSMISPNHRIDVYLVHCFICLSVASVVKCNCQMTSLTMVLWSHGGAMPLGVFRPKRFNIQCRRSIKATPLKS